MGTASHIAKGLGNKDAFCTAPHGAGRRFSRKEAKSLVDMDDFDMYMSELKWLERSFLRRTFPTLTKT